MSQFIRVHTPNSPLLPLAQPSSGMYLSPYTTTLRSRRSFTPSQLNFLPPPSVSPIHANLSNKGKKMRDNYTQMTPETQPMNSSLILSSTQKSMKKIRSTAKYLPRNKTDKMTTAHCDFIAGVFAGACNMFISHPLDTVKTNMQSGNMGFVQATRTLFKTEGPKSYYRGLLFPLCSTGFLNSIIFGVYGNSFRIYQEMCSNAESKQKYWFAHVFLAGSTAGVIKAICACPIELSKVRLQVKVNNETGPLMVFRLIRKTEGFSGIFRGLESMLWRDAIPYGLFMFVYEYLVERMRTPALQRSYHYKEEIVEPWRTAVAGACAGMLSWLPGIPFDVIKTRMMTAKDPNEFKNVWHCFKVITKENGYRYLFRGGTVLVLRSAPVSAVSFIAYENMLRHCQSRYQFS